MGVLTPEELSMFTGRSSPQSAIGKLMEAAKRGDKTAIELLRSLSLKAQGSPSLQAAVKGGTPKPFGPMPGPNPFEGQSPNLRGPMGTKPPANLGPIPKPTGLTDVPGRGLNPFKNLTPNSEMVMEPSIGPNPNAGKFPSIDKAPLGVRARGALGMLGRMAGPALTGASMYGMARGMTDGPTAAPLAGPLGMIGEGLASGVDKFQRSTLEKSMPEMPQGPGLPMNSSQLAPYGPREEFTPEFAQKIIQSLKNRGGGQGAGRRPNPFTYNDQTEMGPDIPQEESPTSDGFPPELLAQLSQGGPEDMSMGSMLPEDQETDPSLSLAAKKNKRNPLMRAIMGIGRGLGKVF